MASSPSNQREVGTQKNELPPIIIKPKGIGSADQRYTKATSLTGLHMKTTNSYRHAQHEPLACPTKRHKSKESLPGDDGVREREMTLIHDERRHDRWTRFFLPLNFFLLFCWGPISEIGLQVPDELRQTLPLCLARENMVLDLVKMSQGAHDAEKGENILYYK